MMTSIGCYCSVVFRNCFIAVRHVGKHETPITCSDSTLQPQLLQCCIVSDTAVVLSDVMCSYEN